MNVVPMDRQARNLAGRTPPHNLDAEQALLGAMLLNPDAINNTAHLVTADDFYKPAHAHIYDAIIALHNRAERPDAITVAAHLDQAGLIDTIGGPSTLTTLQASTPATTNAASYARLIANQAVLRQLIGVAGEIAELGYSNPPDVNAAVDRAETLLYEIGDARADTIAAPLVDVLHNALNRLEARYDNGGSPTGIQTGLAFLDELLGGLGPGVMVTVAARPAMGKTQAGTAIGLNIAEAGTPVLFVSAEMSPEQMGDRILANASGVGLETIRRGDLAEVHWNQIAAGVGKVGDHPFWLYTKAGPTLTDIRSAARRLASTLKQPPVVVVDYLQLMRGPKAENRNNEVAQLSWGLKTLALDLHTVVITLSQLSRQLENRSDKHPMLSDLRDSGAIEQDSDVVIGLYRDEVYNPETEHRGVAELIVLKNRHGRTGTAHVSYNAATGRFLNMVRNMA